MKAVDAELVFKNDGNFPEIWKYVNECDFGEGTWRERQKRSDVFFSIGPPLDIALISLGSHVVSVWLVMSMLMSLRSPADKDLPAIVLWEEAVQVAQGGPRGERARAVRAIREVLGTRVSGAEKPVVTFAMVR